MHTGLYVIDYKRVLTKSFRHYLASGCIYHKILVS